MPRLKSPRRERFCREYMKDRNGTQAYIRAGYSEKGAKVAASKMLAVANVQARIKELNTPVEKEIEDDAKRIREDLRAMSRVEFKDIFNEKYHLRPHDELSHGAHMLISGVKYKDGEMTEVKVHDKLKAIELLGKHFGVSAWEENVNLHDADTRVERMRRYQARRGKRGKNNPLNETGKGK